jgi:phosphoglycerol transferase MdoB-like AlkP superfamily enzyme
MNFILPLFSTSLLCWMSLFFLRLQIAQSLNLSFAQAKDFGILLGSFYDITLLLITAGMVQLITLNLSRPFFKLLLFFILFLFVWFSLYSSVLFYSFFKLPLDISTIYYHWKDSTSVLDSITYLSQLTWIFRSLIIVIIAAIIAGVGIFSIYPPHRTTLTTTTKPLLYRARLGLMFIFFGLLLRQSPVWFVKIGHFSIASRDNSGTMLSQQPIYEWIHQIAKLTQLNSPFNLSNTDTTTLNQNNIQQTYSALKNYVQSDQWPYTYEPDQTLSLHLRKQFGFKPDQPISIITIFVESLRTYEFDHPAYGKKLFSSLHQQLDQRGYYFSQAYSSVLEQGQTSRGLWSVNCSFLPDLGSTAPFILNPSLHQTCLAEILKNHHYQTFSFCPTDKNFHNTLPFETLHGFEQVYDRDWFLKQGAPHGSTALGIHDEDLLNISYDQSLQSLIRESKNHPFLAQILTLSNHHPPTLIPESFKQLQDIHLVPSLPEHQKQWSQIRYTDTMLGIFLNKIWETPGSENVLVLLTGDHSVTMDPSNDLNSEALDPYQKQELYFRIPIALFSRSPQRAMVHASPIHQIDILPSLLQILGLQESSATWLEAMFF